MKEYVRFQQHNLAADDFPVPADRGPWDLILCRNVIIYFDGATISRIVGRFYELLRDGSFLCLGYSESLYRIFNDFVLAEVEGAFLYSKPLQRRPPSLPKARAEDVIAKLREDVERRKASAVPRPSPGPQPQPYKPNQLRTPLPGSVQALNGGDWRSSPGTSVPPTPLAPRLSVSADPLVAVARLVDGGEFLTAFTTLTEALNRSPGNLALQITLGNLCTVMGRTAEARAAYLAALAVEPLCAEAHLCLGIASSEAGAPFDAEALQELTRAIFLDPHVPLAHYYYGRLCERRGDHASARRAYRNAINACRDQRGKTPFLGFYPDLPADPAVLARAAQYALAALEEA